MIQVVMFRDEEGTSAEKACNKWLMENADKVKIKSSEYVVYIGDLYIFITYEIIVPV